MKKPIIIQWNEDSIKHIARHKVTDKEVNTALNSKILMRKIPEGLLEILGEVEGRILFIILKRVRDRYKVITARDANRSEKRLYKKKRK
ncbi:MAG: BrnT family toxin [Euryarchaeota archaeon]|nr:BrnT family toxin [Euryarchaeota archaeon]